MERRDPTAGVNADFSSRAFARAAIERLQPEAIVTEGGRLRRKLGAFDLIAVGLGTMIGGGIFTTIGPGILKAGPAIIVAYLLAGLASFFAALAYAELGAMVPIAGSAYTYAYATLGEVVAWIIGWDLILEYGVSAAPVAQQFSGYAQTALAAVGMVLPAWARDAHFSTDPAQLHVDVLGAAFVLVLSLLLAIGIRETATSNNAFVIVKIGALLVFIFAAVALVGIHPSYFTPLSPNGWGTGGFAGGNGLGIIPAAALVFFSYIGFDTATTTAEETRNPQRDVPLGVIGSLAIGTIVYCTVAFALVGIVPWQRVDQQAALAAAVAPLHNAFINVTIVVGALAGTTSVALTSLLGQTRIFFAMARDGLLPPAVARVNSRFGTPAATTMTTGVVVAVLTLVVPLDVLLELVNIGTFSAFIIVCAGVMWLRERRPELPRPFRSPAVPLFPFCGITLSLYLMTQGLGEFTWLRFLIWLVIGLGIYFAYGYRRATAARP
ncbi:MAG: amino acid permease [Candidatus Eremiobacteraeota bacterium]|nr:amino acid permease [Candidatus Eremiobacteraeota bacterium]